MTPQGQSGQAVEPGPPARKGARARDASARAADWTWGLARRIHLGTRKPENWVQLFKFGVVGATGYVLNLLVFGLLNQGLDVNHLLAAVASFCVAVSNNFLLNRHWTFKATEGHAGFQAARFFAVSVLALGVNLALLYLLVDVASAPELPSQAIAVAFAMPFNFLGNKLWTFGVDGR
ncbi:MAG TPA: GtrA family protein [Solirubrobacterales bacterium]|nr:GtrA family protein [Solirubrobacterales bacterium]